MPKDVYSSYTELVAKGKDREGIDYRICIVSRPSPVAVLAPHGGTIEPRTSEIASGIAGGSHSLYCFEGLRLCEHHELHIASECFDEPQVRKLVAGSDIVIAIHGLKDTALKTQFIEVGGLDIGLRDVLLGKLSAEFDARIAKRKGTEGKDQQNICNMGRTGRGVQLEITRSLRDAIFGAPGRPRLLILADAIQSAISARLESIRPEPALSARRNR